MAGSMEHFHLSHICSAILHLENSMHSFCHYEDYSEELQSYLLQRIFPSKAVNAVILNWLVEGNT